MTKIDIGTFASPAADDDPLFFGLLGLLVLGAMLVVLTSETICGNEMSARWVDVVLRIKPVETVDGRRFQFGGVFEANYEQREQEEVVWVLLAHEHERGTARGCGFPDTARVEHLFLPWLQGVELSTAHRKEGAPWRGFALLQIDLVIPGSVVWHG